MTSNVLYPPRPGGAIPPSRVNDYRNFVAQYKYDDVRVLVYLLPGGGVRIYNRDRREVKILPHKEAVLRLLRALGLSSDRLHVLDGGVLWRFDRGVGLGPRIRPLVLWDVLVVDGRYLLGTTYRERYALLDSFLGRPRSWERLSSFELAWVARETFGAALWLAPWFESEDFFERYRRAIRSPDVEGLVLKNPSGRLERGTRPENNGSWQIRVRRPAAAYAF